MIPVDPTGAAFAVAVLLILGLLACGLLGRLCKLPGAARIAWAVLAAHVLVSSIVYARYGLFANDAQAYDQTATSIAHRLAGDTSYTGVAVTVTRGKEGWVWLLAGIYRAVGHYPFVGVVLNAVLAACVVPVIGLVTARLGWPHAARRAMWIAGFAPPLFIWSTFLLREPAINLCASVAVAGGSLYASTRRWRWLFMTLLAGLALYWLRGTLTVILIGGLLVGLVMAGRLGAHRMRARQAVFLVAVAVITVPIALRVLGALNVSLNSIDVARAALARTANSSFGSASASAGVGGAILTSIRQLPDALFGPLPWQWAGGLGGMLNALDALTWWVFFYYVWRAWRHAEVRRGRWLLAAPALLLFLALALASGNYGTLVRVRGMAVPMLAPLIAVGMMTSRIKRSRRPLAHDRLDRVPLIADPDGAAADRHVSATAGERLVPGSLLRPS